MRILITHWITSRNSSNKSGSQANHASSKWTNWAISVPASRYQRLISTNSYWALVSSAFSSAGPSISSNGFTDVSFNLKVYSTLHILFLSIFTLCHLYLRFLPADLAHRDTITLPPAPRARYRKRPVSTIATGTGSVAINIQSASPTASFRLPSPPPPNSSLLDIKLAGFALILTFWQLIIPRSKAELWFFLSQNKPQSHSESAP